jgi:integrase
MPSAAFFHRQAKGEAEKRKRQPTVKLSPRLIVHLRRWKGLNAHRRTYVVSYHGDKVLGVKTATYTACKLAASIR